MITDLDETLKRLLISEMPIENNDVDVTFDLPKREWSAKLTRPTVNLYIYDIRENTELRQTNWVVERGNNGQATKRRPPRRIDMAYLVTAWTSTAEDEHRLLWRALWALLRYPELPKDLLEGSLKDSEVPIRGSVAQPEEIPNVADLWGVLDNELKPSLHYVATLPLDLAQVITGPLVLSKEVCVEQGVLGEGPFERIVQIAGTVRDGEGQPVLGATVSVKERGYTSVTDDQGRYTFPNVPQGKYTFVVSVPGDKPTMHSVSVLSQDYDLVVD
ncbi:MAG: Pvc16 family protein [Anaerolineae bacterium]|jgi:hypothetical protein